MPTAFEVTIQFSTGSLWPVDPIMSPAAASMQTALAVIADAENTLVSGSLMGVANSYSVNDMDTMFSQSMLTGSMSGPANTVVTSEMIEEEQNTSQTTPGNPSPAEGAVLVDWNAFEVIVDEAPVVTLPGERDSTRFKKAYSFTRQQPVKIRVYRR